MPPPPRRLQSQEERDLVSLARIQREQREQRERQAIPQAGFDDDYTSQYEIGSPELAAKREERDPLARIRHLEDGRDAHRAELKVLRDMIDETQDLVHDTREEITGMRGELKATNTHIPELIKLLKDKTATEHETKRLGMTTRTQIILALIGLFSAGGVGALIAAAIARHA